MIHFSFGTQPMVMTEQAGTQKKNISLFFFKDERWHKEEVDCLWSDDQAATLKNIVSKWLSLADEEEVLQKKVTLLHATFSISNKNAYLSFDRYPFNKESSTHEKYMIIKGIIKTVQSSGLKINSLQFLVHHKPLQDYHLDFSHPWPL